MTTPTPKESKAESAKFHLREFLGNYFITRTEDSFVLAMSSEKFFAQQIIDALNAYER